VQLKGDRDVDLASIFAAMPNAAPLDGLPEAWHWSLAPGLDYSAALSQGYVFQANALRSYDSDLALALLSFAREHSELIAPPERPLVVVEGFSHSPQTFDTVVAVSPRVHKHHARENPELHEVTRAVFPAYRCEFAGDESEEETQYRYARAAGVPTTTWTREPHPYVRMRYRAETGRVIEERGFAQSKTLVHELRTLDGRPDRFVEFENFRHEVWRVEWHDSWVVTGESEADRQLGIDELLEFVKASLYGPNLDAGTGQFA
jgi:hypothetical protein